MLLLRHILTEPLDPRSAAQRLAELQQAEFDDQLEEHVEGVLLRLEELGLVDRVAD